MITKSFYYTVWSVQQPNKHAPPRNVQHVQHPQVRIGFTVVGQLNKWERERIVYYRALYDNKKVYTYNIRHYLTIWKHKNSWETN